MRKIAVLISVSFLAGAIKGAMDAQKKKRLILL